jgi:ferritin-like metal-binding protein YciE
VAHKIKIGDELYDKLKTAAEAAGYSSADELIGHILEQEAERIGGDDVDMEQVKERLKGLGYIS